MKPILFNTDMVRGLPANHKTATRRLVKPSHLRVLNSPYRRQHPETPDKLLLERLCMPPYRPGDILYVRETFFEHKGHFYYKADGKHEALAQLGIVFKWRPSIHMPREAARIFLRVTEVRVGRLQEITPEQLRAEGMRLFVTPSECKSMFDRFGAVLDFEEEKKAFADLWNRCYARPRSVKDENGIIDHYESYPWEDIQETRTYRGKPWYVIGNPWVWVIEFERISREEAAP